MAVDLQIRQEAYKTVNAARREKSLIPNSTCGLCGRPVNTIAHHPDYNKPLEVIWLCRRCHRRVHLNHPITPFVKEDMRTLRIKSSLTQEQLAKKAGLTTATVIAIENENRVPHFATRRALARALKVTVEELGFDGKVD